MGNTSALILAAALALGAATQTESRSAGSRWIGAVDPQAAEEVRREVIESMPHRVDRAAAAASNMCGVAWGTIQWSVELRRPPLGARGAAACVTDRGGSIAAHRVIVFPSLLARDADEIDETLRHELIHVLHREAAGSGAERAPTWIQEGIVVTLTGEGPVLLARALASSLGAKPSAASDPHLEGFLRVLGAAERLQKSASVLAREWIRSQTPTALAAASFGVAEADLEAASQEASRRAWARAASAGREEAAILRDLCESAPVDEALTRLVRYRSEHPNSWYWTVPAVALAERCLASAAAAPLRRLQDLLEEKRNYLPDDARARWERVRRSLAVAPNR
ncbi:MAG: hypothetical protein JNJ88_14110 [Planctomycetes bacterium]|nr:hypothetical protein [Planctomycetota bacterium]